MKSQSSESPKTPLVDRNARIMMMDFSYNQNSQNDVQWGSPQLNTSIPDYEVVEESPVVYKKRKMTIITTPVRIIKRHVSSPALQRQNSAKKSEECKNLRNIFESDEENQSSSDFDVDIDDIMQKAKPEFDKFETSFDAILSSIPLDEISKEVRKGNKNVNIVFDPLAGSSQVVKDNPRVFERHTSMPSFATKRKSPEDTSHQQRRCTPEEIAQKRRQALERLNKNNGTVITSRPKPISNTNPSNAGENCF